MRLGEQVRKLRTDQGLTLRELADRVGVGFTYLCKIETQKLESGHTPSDALLERLAKELGGNAEELILLADRIPASMSERVHERPDAFIALAKLDEKKLDKFIRITATEAD